MKKITGWIKKNVSLSLACVWVLILFTMLAISQPVAAIFIVLAAITIWSAAQILHYLLTAEWEDEE